MPRLYIGSKENPVTRCREYLLANQVTNASLLFVMGVPSTERIDALAEEARRLGYSRVAAIARYHLDGGFILAALRDPQLVCEITFDRVNEAQGRLWAAGIVATVEPTGNMYGIFVACDDADKARRAVSDLCR